MAQESRGELDARTRDAIVQELRYAVKTMGDAIGTAEAGVDASPNPSAPFDDLDLDRDQDRQALKVRLRGSMSEPS